MHTLKTALSSEPRHSQSKSERIAKFFLTRLASTIQKYWAVIKGTVVTDMSSEFYFEDRKKFAAWITRRLIYETGASGPTFAVAAAEFLPGALSTI